MKKFIVYWLPVIFWAAVIFYFSHQPYLQVDLPGLWDFALRKTAHVTEFLILTLLLNRALFAGQIKDYKIKNIILLTAFFAFLYAISDEYHQGFIQGRHPAIKDVGFDSIGVALGSLAYYFILKTNLVNKEKNGKI